MVERFAATTHATTATPSSDPGDYVGEPDAESITGPEHVPVNANTPCACSGFIYNYPQMVQTVDPVTGLKHDSNGGKSADLKYGIMFSVQPLGPSGIQSLQYAPGVPGATVTGKAGAADSIDLSLLRMMRARAFSRIYGGSGGRLWVRMKWGSSGRVCQPGINGAASGGDDDEEIEFWLLDYEGGMLPPEGDALVDAVLRGLAQELKGREYERERAAAASGQTATPATPKTAKETSGALWGKAKEMLARSMQAEQQGDHHASAIFQNLGTALIEHAKTWDSEHGIGQPKTSGDGGNGKPPTGRVIPTPGWEDGPPNPFGPKGKWDHQRKVAELVDRAKKELQPGEHIRVEERVVGYPGCTRKPDVQIVRQNPDGSLKTRKVYEAERNPRGPYNRAREAEYRRRGIPYETHPLD